MNKSYIVVLILFLSGLFGSCGDSDKTEIDESKAIPVKSITIELSEIYSDQRFTGKVIADDRTVISTKIIGQVERVYVNEGDKVRKGELLAKIRSSDLVAKKRTTESAIRSAQLNVKNAERDLQRIQSLKEKGSATTKELEGVMLAKEAAEAALMEAKHNQAEINDYLGYANLRSPINGFVAERMINPGSMAAPGTPVVSIESFSELKIEVNVPEFEISKFQIGDVVNVDIDFSDVNTLAGKVDRVIPSSSSGQFKVIVSLDDNSDIVKPGMFARVNLLKDKENVLLIDRSILIERGQLRGVYTINQQQEAMLRWIQLGRDYGEKVEVLAGLAEGEELIVSSDLKLSDGDKVKN